MKKILPKFAFSLRSASDYIGKINLREVVKSVAKERELVAFAFRYSFLTSLDFRICSLASDTELCTVVCHPIRVLHKRWICTSLEEGNALEKSQFLSTDSRDVFPLKIQ